MDVRTFPPSGPIAATAPQSAPPAGFTAGGQYLVLGIGVDVAPAQPAIYILLIDDAGVLKTVSAASFRFSVWRAPGGYPVFGPP